MRKLLFTTAIALFTFSAVFANGLEIDSNYFESNMHLTVISDFDNTEFNDLKISQQVEEVVEYEFVDSRCRTRTCTYRGGVRVGCTEWRYHECETDDFYGGDLDPVVVIANI
jgi:hypothetical protein